MGLRDYVVPTAIVKIDKKTDFEVRGISFEGVTKIVMRHGPMCAMAYQEFLEFKGQHGLRPEVLGHFVTTAVGKFPEAIVDVIAVAAEEDTDEVRSIIRRLPIGVQIDAVYQIIGLTFSGEADVKKLVEIVTRMATAVSAEIEGLTTPPTPSEDGNGSFVSQ